MRTEDVREEASANERELLEGADAAAGRRAFVEPLISPPVDVLEATSFFQIGDSGVLPP